ncbi:AAA family ATPase [Thermomonas sp.]|uniref:ExeA family protein n=1 Tax=Thermomonas sp. TaxID=1971895 RepID=UPI002D074136|nr:AAA family ATPase [Thermomonas sp.]HRO62599.1 AAA family ATPase [Thermomonas sp.]
MYLAYYGLREPPFSITPDPRFVFLSERHRDALAHLLFGIDKGGGGGFVQLTGEVGTGKTTLSRLLLEQLPEHARIALVLNPRQNAVELLETVCEELHIGIEGKHGSAKALVDALNAYLLDAYAQGLRVVLLIDEAQNLPPDALEQVRLLTNLETHTQKLLQILLLGQPELRDLLARPELRQLAQRITARFHLSPLDERETAAYLRHRWRVAGGSRFPFNAKAVRRLHALSGGVPRLLNVIAERALLAGYARDAVSIDAKLVNAAAREVLPPARAPRFHPLLAVGSGVAVAALIAAAWYFQPWPSGASAAPPKAQPTLSAVPSNTPARLPGPVVDTVDAAAFEQLLTTVNASPTAAWRELLQQWSLGGDAITLTADGSCSPTATRLDLHCIQGSTRLDTLLALDRPLLLRLRAGAVDAWALLLGADARTVRLRIGTRTIDIDRTLLQSRWDGRYAGLWRGPDALAQTPLPGTAGPAVDWLWQQLAAQPPAPGTPYNAALRAAVRELQNARGLPTDGIAGSLTLMALANDLPGPRLQRVLE